MVLLSSTQSQHGVADFAGITESVHGKPKCLAALHLLKAMSSYNETTLLSVFDEKFTWTILPASLNFEPSKKAGFEYVAKEVWRKVDNFKIIPVSKPLEAECDRVILHAKIDPTAHATSSGGTPYENEYMYIVTFVRRNDKYKISDVIEYMDSQCTTMWSTAPPEERAKAAGNEDAGGATSGEIREPWPTRPPPRTNQSSDSLQERIFGY